MTIRLNIVLKHGLALATTLLLATPSFALNGGTYTDTFVHLGTLGSNGLDGILIAPNWVLTAGHVASAGVAFTSALGSATVDAAYRAPGSGFPANDIALLHLGTAIAAAGFPALNAEVIGPSTASTGIPVTIAVTAPSGQNSHLSTTVSDALEIAELDDGSTATVWYLAADGAGDGTPLLQGGDSGGALFFGNAGSSMALLIGIASATDGTRSFFVQPGPYRNWMDSTMAASDQRAGWGVSAIPEPSAAWLFWAGLGLIGYARRRNRCCG